MIPSKLCFLALFSLARANTSPTTRQASGCTTTIVESAGGQPPPKTWEPTWTITTYTSTETAHNAVDCHGCDAVDTATLDIDYHYPKGPEPVITISTAAEPTTVTDYHCSSEPKSPISAAGQELDTRETQSNCTSVLWRGLPHLTFGPVRTVWTTTTVSTSTIYCGGCENLRLTAFPLGVPPVVFFDTTVTATGPSTTTEFACGLVKPTQSVDPDIPIRYLPSREPHDRRAPAPTSVSFEHVQQTQSIDPDIPIRYLPGHEPPQRRGATHTSDPFEEFATSTVTPKGVSQPDCTTTKALGPTIPNPISTAFTSTVTSTSSVDCSGCVLEWSTGVINFFAPLKYTSTITASEPSTKTNFACEATGHD